jgi:nucleotide-binding universal stress UspA family protein
MAAVAIHPAAHPIRRILLATDFSEPAHAAVAAAHDLARQIGGRVHVLHVARVPWAIDEVALARVADELAVDVPVEAATRVGHPAAEIVGYAAEHAIDVIVAGEHGATGVTHLLLGSVAERVARTAPCPVLLVPHDGRGALELGPPPVLAPERCAVCGAATESFLCDPCRARVRALRGEPSPLRPERAGQATGPIDRAEMIDLLDREIIGRLGMNDDGRLYVLPMNYVHHDGALYVRSTEGLKVRILRRNPEVCFQVDHILDLARWRSVIVWGRFHELEGMAATEGLGRILRRFGAFAGVEGGRPAPAFDLLAGSDRGHRAFDSGRGAVIGRIDIVEMTGRYEQA